jgi:hypothetical protein
VAVGVGVCPWLRPWGGACAGARVRGTPRGGSNLYRPYASASPCWSSMRVAIIQGGGDPPQEGTQILRLCKQCKKPVTRVTPGRGRPPLHCSDRCRREWAAANNGGRKLTRTCTTCGGLYVPRRPGCAQRSCSSECARSVGIFTANAILRGLVALREKHGGTVPPDILRTIETVIDAGQALEAPKKPTAN